MGFIENIKQRFFPVQEVEPTPESQYLLELFYKNPYAVYYHSSGHPLTYTGDYDSLIFCYNNKRYPLVNVVEPESMNVSFLWTDAHHLPRIEQSSFEAIVKPYIFLYSDSNGMIDTPSIEIIEEPSYTVGYKKYNSMWNNRVDQIKKIID